MDGQMPIPGLEHLLAKRQGKALTLWEQLAKMEDRVYQLELEVTLLRAYGERGPEHEG